ncbi:threonine synthase [Brevibacillus dissolubilis]|uniref:threonine synthase n=1 Tax=Brevibacillus dissolubilis TaxID=1844116 RepID=UPI001116FE9D|nr:pyridoxal-phosphate dependent enzyme [Brevibacillus dissolubilis]
MYSINYHIQQLTCLRCGRSYATSDFPTGCPACLSEGTPASLHPQYDQNHFQINPDAERMMRYRDWLPYRSFPTLGEGGTPLLRLPDLAKEAGLTQLWLKNETVNPTGSHKDRFSPFVIARALMLGRQGVMIASSGNAGLSLAAYAAHAGLRCILFTTAAISPTIRQTVEATGGEVRITETDRERWDQIRQLAEEQCYYPATNFIFPPVGSNLYGIQGYKTIAYELFEQWGRDVPSVVVVPTSRGDLLWGIWQGFKDLHRTGRINRLPRMVSVEPFARLSRVLDEGMKYTSEFPGSTTLFSIGGNCVAYQAVQALQESGGCAIEVDAEEAAGAIRRFARSGLFLESSSATVLPAVQRLSASGWIGAEDSVVMIGTSHGFKGL